MVRVCLVPSPATVLHAFCRFIPHPVTYLYCRIFPFVYYPPSPPYHFSWTGHRCHGCLFLPIYLITDSCVLTPRFGFALIAVTALPRFGYCTVRTALPRFTFGYVYCVRCRLPFWFTARVAVLAVTDVLRFVVALRGYIYLRWFAAYVTHTPIRYFHLTFTAHALRIPTTQRSTCTILLPRSTHGCSLVTARLFARVWFCRCGSFALRYGLPLLCTWLPLLRLRLPDSLIVVITHAVHAYLPPPVCYVGIYTAFYLLPARCVCLRFALLYHVVDYLYLIYGYLV